MARVLGALTALAAALIILGAGVPAEPTNGQITIRNSQDPDNPPAPRGTCGIAATGGTAKYVKSSASGAGTGADWTNAMAFPTSPTRGTTYCLADGSYGSKTLTLPAGTTAITYVKATPADHGTATGWSDALGDGTADFTHLDEGGNGTGFLTFSCYSEVASGNLGCTIAFAAGSTGFDFGSGAHDDTISYLDISAPATTTTCAIGVDLGFEGANATKSNITISHNKIHGADTNAQIHTATNIVFEYNEFFGNSSTSSCHGNVLLAQSCIGPCVFRYNLVHDWRTEGLFLTFPGATQELPSEQNTWDVYGNIFYEPVQGESSRAIESHQDGTDGGYLVKLYNNTFVGPTDFVVLSMNHLSASSDAYNNLFYNCAGSGSGITGWSTHDYSWTLTCGTITETHVQNGSADPFVDSANHNYHLAAETTAGLTLASPYTVDRDGVTRGSIGTWDRGAYEK